MHISAVILTKNEEKNIQACIETLLWCSEIIVIDDRSSDKTIPLAKEAGAKVFCRALSDNFASQRNFGLKKAKGEWILFIDPDERVTNDLAEEIKHALQNAKYQGYSLRRKDFLWGRWLQYGDLPRKKIKKGLIPIVRLGRKASGMWEHPVHEVWNIQDRIGELKSPLLHYPHPTTSDFLQEIDYYSTLRAKELFQEGIRTNMVEMIAYPMGKFLNNFFISCGFLDGMPGLLSALMMSFHSFLTRSKLWLLSRRDE